MIGNVHIYMVLTRKKEKNVRKWVLKNYAFHFNYELKKQIVRYNDSCTVNKWHCSPTKYDSAWFG